MAFGRSGFTGVFPAPGRRGAPAILTPFYGMAEALAQIVCVRQDGKDPRTVVSMAPVATQLEAIKGFKKWDGQTKRPNLELWSDSGEKLDPKTGAPLPKPAPAPKAKPAQASTPEPLNASTPS